MTENIEPAIESTRGVEVTYTQEHKAIVKVPVQAFLNSLGPNARYDAFGPRVDSLMAGFVQKQISRRNPDFDAIPVDAHVVRVDVK